MELKFLGRGAAFNPKEGNNSAFFVDNNRLFLIDCGETVFGKLYQHKFLDRFNEINILITHTHSDHVGSLGSLIMYAFFCLKKKVNIIVPTKGKQIKDNIKNILYGYGCRDNMFELVDEKRYKNKYKEFKSIKYLKTFHQEGLDCYGILFNTKDGVIYYSGDTTELNNVKTLIKSGMPVDKLYIDTTSANYPGTGHLYVGDLAKTIPAELKNKTYCMHFNNDECIKLAKQFGLNVVTNYDLTQTLENTNEFKLYKSM